MLSPVKCRQESRHGRPEAHSTSRLAPWSGLLACHAGFRAGIFARDFDVMAGEHNTGSEPRPSGSGWPGTP